MLSPSGQPLKRKYFCSADGKALSSKEIVKGYEKDDGGFVIIDDDELEALSPRKSRDIDLRVFVDRDEIPVRLLQRPYVLAPGGESSKAYHLLAETMERTKLAGIATFVMRGKEYLAAIVSEGGLLRAFTLHFADEVRSPEAVGLPPVKSAPSSLRKQAQAALRDLRSSELNTDVLKDENAARLLTLAEMKHKASQDVVESTVEAEEPDVDDEEGDIVDIMAVLRRRMQEGTRTKSKQTPVGGDALQSETRKTLYERAQEMDLPGRSSMTKDELIEALREAS